MSYSKLTEVQKEARRKYYREYHKRPERREKLRVKAVKDIKVRRLKIKALIHAAKDKPCTDCGNSYPPEIMDLDHVRGKKEFDLCHCTRAKYWTFQQIRDEIAKCDPRCPTCHRLRHYYLKLGHPPSMQP